LKLAASEREFHQLTMNRTLLILIVSGTMVIAIAVGIGLLLLALMKPAPAPSVSSASSASSAVADPPPMDSGYSIPFQGQQVKLSKPYDDYDDYKNDPNNIAASEVPKVQNLVQTAPIAKRFTDRLQMVTAIQEVCFPGYGTTSCGEKPQPDGSVLALFSVEIPKAGKDRFFLFRGAGGVYTLIDDFVYSEDGSIMNVAMSGKKLVYSKMNGTTVVERTPSIP
jgi:hypothetical protein